MKTKRSWHKCANCGRWIAVALLGLIDPRVNICQQCIQEIRNPKTEQEKEDELYAYWNTECDMCGKEGASPRKDGRNYCDHCWTVWNS